MEFIDLLRYFGALLLVLAMVAGAGLLARRFGVPGVTRATAHKRLAIVETLMVGPRQKLFIVRRDNVEHLVLSGPEGATVLENLLLGRHRAGHGSLLGQMLNLPSVQRAEAQTRARVEDVVRLLELAPVRHRLVAELPYGVRKVVELARALASEPRLLLLDEPASGLNPDETRQLACWIADIQAELGITVVMVEHDMSLVSSVAQRVVVMDQGSVLMIGKPAEVQSDARVISAYLGA